jgi:hypothetical protein
MKIVYNKTKTLQLLNSIARREMKIQIKQSELIIKSAAAAVFTIDYFTFSHDETTFFVHSSMASFRKHET